MRKNPCGTCLLLYFEITGEFPNQEVEETGATVDLELSPEPDSATEAWESSSAEGHPEEHQCLMAAP